MAERAPHRGADAVALLAEGVDRNTTICCSPINGTCRPPRGGRGSKFVHRFIRFRGFGVALLAEGVDRNCLASSSARSTTASPSSRRAWIEILRDYFFRLTELGRPPRGGRGSKSTPGEQNPFDCWGVALLAEGVDRNHVHREGHGQLLGRPPRGGRGSKSPTGPGRNPGLLSPSSRRAWIEIPLAEASELIIMSPSSRRAWIEIPCACMVIYRHKSPSSRRAWIEMHTNTTTTGATCVALLAEGVDRN